MSIRNISSWFRRTESDKAAAISSVTLSLSPEQAQVAAALVADVKRMRHLNSEHDKQAVKEWKEGPHWEQRRINEIMAMTDATIPGLTALTSATLPMPVPEMAPKNALLPEDQEHIAAELAADVSRFRRVNREEERKLVKEWMQDASWRSRYQSD